MSSRPEEIRQVVTGRSRSGQSEGLCVTCESVTNCCFQKSVTEPVLFCEEFHVSSARMQVAEMPGSVNLKKEATGVALYTGLCMNSESKNNCVYPQAGAGGWFCEEYA
jgi:hypothetical protein